MAKKLYEVAAELQMRGEHLRDLLRQKGFEFNSLNDPLSAQIEEEIRGYIKSQQSTWDRLKGLSKRQSELNLFETARDVGKPREQDLIDQPDPEEILLESPIPVDFEAKKGIKRENAFLKPGKIISKIEDREQKPIRGKTPESVLTDRPLSSPDAVFEDSDELSGDDSILEEPEGEKISEDESILNTLNRIAQINEEEPDADRQVTQELPDEPLSEDFPEQLSRIPDEIEPVVDVESVPVEQSIADSSDQDEQLRETPESVLSVKPEEEPVGKPKELESEPLPESLLESIETTPFSADDLLESQISESEIEEVSPEVAPVTDLEESRSESEDRVEASTENLEEMKSEAVSKMQDESLPPGMDESVEAEDKDSFTIDDLMGEDAHQEELQTVEAAAEEIPATPIDKTQEEDSKEDLLDTESLLGLEFSETDASGPKSADRKDSGEEEPEGVGIEDLLGLEKEEPKKSVTKSKKIKFADTLKKILSEVSNVILRPRQWSNLELIFVCCIFLVTLSVGFYTLYRWYNFNRPGLDRHFYERAELLRQANRYEDALDTYQLVLKFHPESPWVIPSYYGIADSYYQMNNYQEAIPVYKRALACQKDLKDQNQSIPFPDFLKIPEARFNYTRSLMKVGDYGNARDQLVELAAEYPGEEIGLKSRMILGELYSAWAEDEARPEKYRNAITEYNLALNEYPNSPHRVDLLTRIGDLYRVLYSSQSDEEKEPALLEEASLQYESAVQEAMVEDLPFDEVTQLKIAWADTRVETGDIPGAIELYEKLLRSDLPLNRQVEVLEKIARMHLEKGDILKAEQRAKELMNRNPDDSGLALAYYILGDAEWERGRKNRDFTKMMQHYQRALNLDENSGLEGSNSQRAYMRMTNVMYLENSDFENAAEKYQMIIDRYPEGLYTYRAKFYLGECLEKLGRNLEAANAYQQCVRDFENTKYINPEFYRDALFRRGKCLFDAQQWVEAVEADREALRSTGFPDIPLAIEARERLANSHIALGNYPLAEQILFHLFSKYPQTDSKGQVSFTIGNLRERTFNYNGAREVYLNLLRSTKDLEVSKMALDRLSDACLMQIPGAEPDEVDSLRLASINTLEEKLSRFPDQYSAELPIGKLYQELGDNQQARMHLQQFLSHATAKDPQVEAAVLLGEIAWEEGRYTDAQSRFELVEQFPPFPGDKSWRARARYRLAECYRRREMLSKAQQTYKKVIEDFPDTPWAKEAEWKLNKVDWQMEVSMSPSAGS